MKNIFVLALLAGLAWFGYNKYQTQSAAHASPGPVQAQVVGSDGVDVASFECDGRTHCSQMTSCAEATYFIQHCPNTKMDGNKDGVPCERQWCGR